MVRNLCNAYYFNDCKYHSVQLFSRLSYQQICNETTERVTLTILVRSQLSFSSSARVSLEIRMTNNDSTIAWIFVFGSSFRIAKHSVRIAYSAITINQLTQIFLVCIYNVNCNFGCIFTFRVEIIDLEGSLCPLSVISALNAIITSQIFSLRRIPSFVCLLSKCKCLQVSNRNFLQQFNAMLKIVDQTDGARCTLVFVGYQLFL